jgi:hypothetical protein
LKKKPVAVIPIFGGRIDLPTDEGLHQPGRERGLLLRDDASLNLMCLSDHRAVWSSSVARPACHPGE